MVVETPCPNPHLTFTLTSTLVFSPLPLPSPSPAVEKHNRPWTGSWSGAEALVVEASGEMAYGERARQRGVSVVPIRRCVAAT